MQATKLGSGVIFSPLARAIMDAFGEGVIVFGKDDRVVYVSDSARDVAGGILQASRSLDELLPGLERLGGRRRRIQLGSATVAEAIYLPTRDPTRTLAERERETILAALEANGWRVVEVARELGISRTTLWRRLRVYGFRPDGSPAGPQKKMTSDGRRDG